MPRKRLPADIRDKCLAMKEKDLRSKVVAKLDEHGFDYIYGVRRTDKGALISRKGIGFPDILAIRDGMILVVELKQQRKYVRPEQRLWLDQFKKAQAFIMVCKPYDLLSGELDNLLTGLSEIE